MSWAFYNWLSLDVLGVGGASIFFLGVSVSQISAFGVEAAALVEAAAALVEAAAAFLAAADGTPENLVPDFVV